ncbi:right-handed parallel beta-helix repeat-containing protein [Longitalea luteola]|uniref:right-handed parallel beta-helix repeat-containing protein n=1 Tax=Longitalea luteola TaxID=2812563 RepID=UPI001A95B522|nr:right-handed parallel beta-helix repeat-containing protein [Longitalea luteola]
MRKILRGHVVYKIFLFTLCLGSSFLFEAHAQVSGTFTINSGAPASATNFQTFAAAVASLSGGVNGAVTFNVVSGSGPYTEQVVINAIAGASATNTITFNGNGETLNFLSTDYNSRAGIKLNGADYVTFDNLNIQPLADAPGEYGYGVHILNDADHNTIKNCHITCFVDWDNYDNHAGIVINGSHANTWDEGDSNCDDNLILHNTITGGTAGITLSSIPVWGNPAQFMTGNRIIGNTISNAIFYGIQMYYTSSTLIDGNDITGGPDAIYDLIGMYLAYYNQSFVITNNRIHGFHAEPGSTLTGLFISSESVAGKECLFANNLIYDFQTAGTVIGIVSRLPNTVYSTSFLNIYHNTISLDDQSVPGTDAFGMQFDNVSDVNIMNNIVTVTRRSSNINYGIYFEVAPTNFTSQRNDIYVPDGPATNDAVGVIRSVVYNTMAAWQKATGYDYFSTDVNPIYANPAAFDFRPTAQGIDNMAVYQSINTDITGAPRSTSNPDVGCYEFLSAACSSTITGGTVNALPDSILCIGPKISLGLTGHSAGGGQTYTWQTSTTATGTYSNITGQLGFPYLETTPVTTLFYRVALTCGTTTAYSKPIRVLVNTSLNGGTYTINSELPTGGINFNSFKDAALALQCGINGPIVFNVASGSGPYNEQLILPALSTSPTKTVTFNCNGVTMSYAPTTSSQSAVLKLNGTDYITIDSLNVDVQGSSTFGFGIQLTNDADHNTIKRCTINLSKTATTNRYAGIVISGAADNPTSTVGYSDCDTNLITNNTVIGGSHGITNASNSISPGVSRSRGNIIRKNILKDNYQYGIYLTGASKTLVDSNDISQPTRTVLAAFTGIYLLEVNFGVTVSRNKIHNLAENAKTTSVLLEGIKCELVKALPTEPIVITNNLLYTWRGSGVQNGLNNISSQHVKYYHNTVSLDDSSSGNPSLTRGFGAFGMLNEGIEIKDNNIVVRRGGTGAKYGFYTNVNDSGLVANFNNYYISSTEGPAIIGYMTTDYPTLPQWLATRKDSNSISIDPVPHDPAKGDYTPTKIPFENRGSNVGITTDIRDVTRDLARPDIGAVEFTICRQLTNPVISADSVGVNAIRFSWPAVQNTTGYRVSRDGINWAIPSSGAMGLTHIIAGLKPADTAGLMVKALGSRIDCPEYLSGRVVSRTLTDGIYVPNTFTPNGNGQNDVFKVYSNMMRSIRWMVFNQWGEKVFETTELQGAWDGRYKGKPQPVGVYVFVVSGTLSDGTKVTQKGTFNLIR